MQDKDSDEDKDKEKKAGEKDKQKGIIDLERDKRKYKEKGIEIKDEKGIDTETEIDLEKDKGKEKDKTIEKIDKPKARQRIGNLVRHRSNHAIDSRKTGHLPILTPPRFKDEAVANWYRHASDTAQVPGAYEMAEEDFDGKDKLPTEASQMPGERAKWGNQVEFLMSCIATSVGLGNVWRFAFVAYENGGGAFLIPYIVVLMLIGKPMYFLECIIGQFSSRNSVRIWSLAPAMRGTGYAQCLCTFYVLSYYVAIVSLCLYYLIISCINPLPWTWCRPDWVDCLPSNPAIQNAFSVTSNGTSSAEFYFLFIVLQQTAGLEGGLGTTIWYLTLCLLFCWTVIFGIVVQGVKSSGKAAYFLAVFPYVILIILLITTCTLPGAGTGILFFITPQWGKITEIGVWYAATTQRFYLVTTLDTLTSLLSGFTIFGILGNLAHELNAQVDEVVGSGGTGLAFISYPDALSKTFHPHIFAVLFFLMMFVLGIGSAVALLSTINTVLLDAFRNVRTLYISLVSCVLGFISGLVYCTPEGQYILTLVDHFGGTFLALFTCIAELVGIVWVYGLENFCLDMEYMLHMKASIYWRFCWGLITPVIMLIVFFYALINFDGLLYGGYYRYPIVAYICGYMLLFLGILFVPICTMITFYKNWSGKCKETSNVVFKPKPTWGPRSLLERQNWSSFKDEALLHQEEFKASKIRHFWLSLTGGYRRNVRVNQNETTVG